MRFDLSKSRYLKIPGIITVSVITASHLTGCCISYKPLSETASHKEDIVRAPCPIEFIGVDEHLDHKTAPDFTIFIKDQETGKWNIYATYIGDKKEQFVGLVEGDYLLYSRDIGEYEFSVDDLDREYKITADYENCTFTFE